MDVLKEAVALSQEQPVPQRLEAPSGDFCGRFLWEISYTP